MLNLFLSTSVLPQSRTNEDFRANPRGLRTWTLYLIHVLSTWNQCLILEESLYDPRGISVDDPPCGDRLDGHVCQAAGSTGALQEQRAAGEHADVILAALLAAVVSGDGDSAAPSGGHHQKNSGGSSDGQGCPRSLSEGVRYWKPGREDDQAGGASSGPCWLREGQEETCDPAAEIFFLSHPGLCSTAEDNGVHGSTLLAGGSGGCLHAVLEKEKAARNIAAGGRGSGEACHRTPRARTGRDANNNAAVSEETFTVVKGRRGRRRDAHQAGEVERGSQPSRPRQRKVRLRPDAIVVKATGTTTYADILRKLYAEPALQETVGKSVQCIRRSASGAMVLQLRKGVQNASALGTELDGVLGDAATASALRHKTALEIRDLDECATKAEICTALGHQLGTANLDPDVVRSLRKAYASTQTAVMDLPDELAAEALKLGHLRVGWVSCRVRERAEASRCFRCWEFDHVAARCAGPDRSKLCYRQAAIWVRGGLPVQDRPSRPLPFFTLAHVSDVYIFSVYAPPRLSNAEFSALLANVVEEAQHKRPLIIAGDFNAWSTEWGSSETKPRGVALLDALSALDVVLLNTGHTPTFTGPQGSSIIDLSFASDSLTPRVAGWRVDREVFMNSDHRAITFNRSAHRPHRSSAGPRRRWCARKLDVEAFSEQLSGARIPNANATPGHPEDMAAALITAITEACSVSMPSGGGRRRRHEPVYWWTDEIAALRWQCLRARRLAQRARGRAAEEARLADFAIAKSRLRAAIEESKRRCWSALCNEVDRDVWGRPYGTVMSRLRGPRATPPREPTLVRRTVAALFPTVTEALIRPPAGPAGAVIPGVTLEEPRGACTRIRDGAAPGPDGVPNRALKLAVVLRPDAFLRVY
ncbi:unnamed protein product [Trichogramma brassicae]|uniref:Endonuclease/exonuclease/phosphatase domain-containing protein n=1 Tax=Trichogramma brassicae TaxID=86971 RepID=A0A6H5IIX1_9HYME|nr:unnamed protein product [Trichogramma brassicae]